MRNEAYERAYCDAREVLYNRGKKVCGPHHGLGIRYCRVDGLPLTDRELLIEAWGERLADEILAELARSESLPNCCPEGNRLWLQYAAATKHNLQILIEQQITARKLDSATLTELALVLKSATELRRQSRRAQFDHAETHPRGAASLRTNSSCQRLQEGGAPLPLELVVS